MLDDYVDDLKKSLTERRESLVASVIHTGDPVTRGMVQALDMALSDVEELANNYREPEAGPPAVRQSRSGTFTAISSGRRA